MASEYLDCKEKNSIIDFEDNEKGQIESGNHFDAIHDISDGQKVKEEPMEIISFNDQSNKNCMEQREDEKFNECDSNKFEFTLRESVEDPREIKLSPIHVCEHTNFIGDASECGLVEQQENPEDNQYDIELKIKNKNQVEFSILGDFFTNYAHLKTESIKTEDAIDIIYDDVKPAIFEEKSGGMSENKCYLNPTDDISMGIKMELSIDSLYQNAAIEEDGIDGKKDYSTRKKPTITTKSKNGQMIHSEKEPHQFDYSSNLKQEIFTEDKRFKCKSCSKSFTTKQNMLCHKRVHTGEKLFHCKICSKTIASKSHFTEHGRIHTGEKPFQCKICSKLFTWKRNLVEHERIHTEEKPFQCKNCSKSFFNKNNCLKHERNHEGDKPFQCQICSNSFKQKIHLEQHERLHTGEKPFKCKMCSKSFAHKKSCLQHEIIHTGHKPFQCKICSKIFVIKSYLVAHMRIHTGEKPFQCKICSKLFAWKQSLLEHEKIHTREEPFQCEICLESFAYKKRLLQHEIIHTGGKLFQCEICSKYFAQKGYLLKHIRIHTGKKPFQCKICLKSFGFNHNLLKHEKIHAQSENHFNAQLV